MTTYGFIGCGNMGGALACAVSRMTDPANVYLANRTQAKAEALAAELHANATTNEMIARECDCIFLGVKPQMMEEMLRGIRPFLRERSTPPVLVTMAAALTIADIRRMVDADCHIIRIMPNTPVSVGEGVILYTCDESVTDDEKRSLLEVLSDAGMCVPMPEKLIDAGSALSGCGPAFAQMFIEGLADGAVACGVPRTDATRLAAQMLLGSAKLTIESGKSPGTLKEEVCSPGGTTIQGVRVLEERAFGGAAMDAVIASYEKTLAMKTK